MEETLAGALTPPDPHALRESLQQLRTLGALEDHQTAGEAMTPLGHMLVRMPVDPHVGKALIFGALLGCLDAALTVAAALGYGKGVFVAPMERRNEANAAKAALAGQSRSDHMAVVEAFRAWSEAKAGGRAAASQLCRVSRWANCSHASCPGGGVEQSSRCGDGALGVSRCPSRLPRAH